MDKLRVELRKTYIGYTLAEDVYKEKETKLIGKDTLLTERIYESLKRHEIRYVYVYQKEETA